MNAQQKAIISSHLSSADHQVEIAQKLVPASHKLRSELLSIRERLSNAMRSLDV